MRIRDLRTEQGKQEAELEKTIANLIAMAAFEKFKNPPQYQVRVGQFLKYSKNQEILQSLNSDVLNSIRFDPLIILANK